LVHTTENQLLYNIFNIHKVQSVLVYAMYVNYYQTTRQDCAKYNKKKITLKRTHKQICNTRKLAGYNITGTHVREQHDEKISKESMANF